jgi:hypothetical protein
MYSPVSVVYMLMVDKAGVICVVGGGFDECGQCKSPQESVADVLSIVKGDILNATGSAQVEYISQTETPGTTVIRTTSRAQPTKIDSKTTGHRII